MSLFDVLRGHNAITVFTILGIQFLLHMVHDTSNTQLGGDMKNLDTAEKAMLYLCYIGLIIMIIQIFFK